MASLRFDGQSNPSNSLLASFVLSQQHHPSNGPGGAPFMFPSAPTLTSRVVNLDGANEVEPRLAHMTAAKRLTFLGIPAHVGSFSFLDNFSLSDSFQSFSASHAAAVAATGGETLSPQVHPIMGSSDPTRAEIQQSSPTRSTSSSYLRLRQEPTVQKEDAGPEARAAVDLLLLRDTATETASGDSGSSARSSGFDLNEAPEGDSCDPSAAEVRRKCSDSGSASAGLPAAGSGGRRSQKRKKIPDGAQSTKTCPKCGRTFSTGQALGGHMRKHWEGAARVQTKQLIAGERRSVSSSRGWRTELVTASTSEQPCGSGTMGGVSKKARKSERPPAESGPFVVKGVWGLDIDLNLSM